MKKKISMMSSNHTSIMMNLDDKNEKPFSEQNTDGLTKPSALKNTPDTSYDNAQNKNSFPCENQEALNKSFMLTTNINGHNDSSFHGENADALINPSESQTINDTNKTPFLEESTDTLNKPPASTTSICITQDDAHDETSFCGENTASSVPTPILDMLEHISQKENIHPRKSSNGHDKELSAEDLQHETSNKITSDDTLPSPKNQNDYLPPVRENQNDYVEVLPQNDVDVNGYVITLEDNNRNTNNSSHGELNESRNPETLNKPSTSRVVTASKDQVLPEDEYNDIDEYEYILQNDPSCNNVRSTHSQAGTIQSVSSLVSQRAEEVNENSQPNHFDQKKCSVCGISRGRVIVLSVCISLFLVAVIVAVILVVYNITSKKSVNQEVQDVLEDSQTFIGFTSWKTNKQTLKRNSLIVIFDSASINIEQLYNTTTSSFRCQYSGVYWVTLTINTVPGKDQLYAHVYKGSEVINGVGNYFTNPGNTISNSAIFYCHTNNTLTVKSFGSNNGTVNGDINIPYTTLTIMMITQDQSDFVAFSAHPRYTREYSKGDVLNFNRQILNTTNCYNRTSGQFTCPVTGVYYITLSLYKYIKKQVQLGVEHQGSTILHSIDTNSESSMNTVTNSRLVECDEGDVITIKGLGSGTLYGGRDTTFSGMLMTTKGISQMGPFQFIGFTATKTFNQTYWANTVIQFDKILTQRGNGFDKSSGNFSCPSQGIYFVSLNARRRGSRPLQVDVKHESTVVFRLKDTESSQNPGCSDGICENPDNTISNSVLVRCGPGETIQVVGAGDGDIYGDKNYIVTTFTVMRVN